MKVVGLSGAQGGGKSSLLAELQRRGWRLDPFRVSRAVQAQLGWESLDNVLTSFETMVQFQNEVDRQKYNRDSALEAKRPFEFEPTTYPKDITLTPRPEDPRERVILTERTFADIAAYTAYWVWELHSQGKVSMTDAARFLGEYHAKCLKHQEIYSGVLLLPYMADQIKWEDDPNRAKRDNVTSIYEDVERFAQRRVFLTQRRYTITAKTISDRADQVEAFLRTL